MRELLEKKFFPYVIKPGRYTGGEPGQIVKDPTGRLKYLHAYPDKYEIGQSYVGLQTLYHVVNRDDRFLCERVFAVDRDAEQIMRRESIPLFSLESSRPAAKFDAIGFTLTYELVFTNMLAMLDLAGIPLHWKDRTDYHPLVLAGGPAVYNPEPIADFVDLFFIGDAEEGLPEMLGILSEMQGRTRVEKLEHLCRNVESVYIPRFYDESRQPLTEFAPATIKARVIPELKPEFYPAQPILPLIDTVHSHLGVEIMRGCPQGCRFCQAGPIYRPVRVRPQRDVIEQIDTQIRNTGYDSVALLSLSTSDYPHVEQLAAAAAQRLEPMKVSISVPSLRPGTIHPELLDAVRKVRRAGLTIAPEAGTERLRSFIRKNFSDDTIYHTARLAFQKGWATIKLYFMIGLPTETDEDLDGIVNVIHNINEIGRAFQGKKTINVMISPFVPEPHTPFQWDEITSQETILQKIRHLKKRCRSHAVHFKHHMIEVTILEGVLGRGGREVARVILSAFRSGCRFDGWSEEFEPQKWLAAFEEYGISLDEKLKPISFTADLPWSHIKKGVSIEHLQRERQRTSTEQKEFQPVVAGSAADESPSDRRAEFGRSKKKVVTQTTAAPTKNHVRVRWGRSARYKYLSHLDNIRLLERAIRRARLPVVYSQGFNPTMKLSFGPPLPLGFTSKAECVDLILETNLMPYMVENLKNNMPEGTTVYEARVVFGKAPSLSSALNRVVYTLPVEKSGAYADLIEKAHHLMHADTLPVERAGKSETKTIDVRPAIYDIRVENDALTLTLGLGDGGYVRPLEVLELLNPGGDNTLWSYACHRQAMYRQEQDGRIISAMDI